MSDLVEHAKRELALVREDPEIIEATLRIVDEFSKIGHSGASAHFHAAMIDDLLRFKNLSPLTSDPSEWVEVGHGLWQNARNSEAFSTDGGVTYYLLSERKRHRWPRSGWTKPMHTSEPSRTTPEGD